MSTATKQRLPGLLGLFRAAGFDEATQIVLAGHLKAGHFTDQSGEPPRLSALSVYRRGAIDHWVRAQAVAAAFEAAGCEHELGPYGVCGSRLLRQSLDKAAGPLLLLNLLRQCAYGQAMEVLADAGEAVTAALSLQRREWRSIGITLGAESSDCLYRFAERCLVLPGRPCTKLAESGRRLPHAFSEAVQRLRPVPRQPKLIRWASGCEGRQERLQSRQAWQVRRLALLWACCYDIRRPAVTHEAMDWAESVVERSEEERREIR